MHSRLRRGCGRRVFPAGWLAAAVLVVAGCGDDGGAGAERIMIVGSSTVAPVLGDIARAFEAIDGNVRIEVQTGGSTRGILDVRDGLAQLGMVSRAPLAAEADLGSFTLAHDGVAIVVHADNPVLALERRQVVDIFTGRVRDWSEVGPGSGTITVVSKAEGRSTLDVFAEHLGITYRDIRADMVIGDNLQGIQAVTGNRLAIGYVAIGTAEYEAASGTPVRMIALDGYRPSSAAVAEGTYPLRRPLNLVYAGTPGEGASRLLQFMGSAEAAEIIQRHYFVPVQP